jgi:hypothetical protein
MNVSCDDRERIFIDGTGEEWAALQAHAKTCAACAEELRAWNELSAAAEELRDYRENPALWSRIQTSLTQQAEQLSGHQRWWKNLMFWRGVPLAWQMSLAGALALVLAVAGGYVVVKRNQPAQVVDNRFLKDPALAEVERTEREYMRAIDKLAVEAKPQMDAKSLPLIAGYQEKLVVLDSAIDELRVQAGQNPSNAHLRFQLLAMYRDKEATLQEILEMKR